MGKKKNNQNASDDQLQQPQLGAGQADSPPPIKPPKQPPGPPTGETPELITADTAAPLQVKPEDKAPRRPRTRRTREQIEADKAGAAQVEVKSAEDKARASIRVLARGVNPLVKRIIPPELGEDDLTALEEGCTPYFVEHGGDIPPGVLAGLTIFAVFGPRIADRLFPPKTPAEKPAE